MRVCWREQGVWMVAVLSQVEYRFITSSCSHPSFLTYPMSSVSKKKNLGLVQWYGIWPVLKHGPRSLTGARVIQSCSGLWGEANAKWMIPFHLGAIRIGEIFLQDSLNHSVPVGTRKMVNYAWAGWSREKSRWRSVAVLTCKSIVRPGYRGERLIEPSSSWFLLKFPSG